MAPQSLDELRLHRGRLPVAAHGEADRARHRAQGMRQGHQLARAELVLDLVLREQHDALTRQQHRAGRDQRVALDRRHRRRPAEARQQRIEVPPQRRAAPRRDPRKRRQRGERRCAAAGQRMPGPHDDRQRVLEQVFLHDVLVRDRITQGADQHVGGAAAQGAEHALVRPIQDSEPVLGPQVRELEHRARHQHAARQRHRPDHRGAAAGAMRGCHLGLRLRDLGKGQPRAQRPAFPPPGWGARRGSSPRTAPRRGISPAAAPRGARRRGRARRGVRHGRRRPPPPPP